MHKALTERHNFLLLMLLFFVLLASCGRDEKTVMINHDNSQQSPKMQWSTLDGKEPIVIAHRGASGYLPEHTLAAYDLAIDLGADYIEPDLVITKDGVLVARHDRYLSTTTNVADHPEFADRRTQKDGHDGVDWFVEDFTLAELKTLRAIQPRSGRSQEWDGVFEVPTFEEILQLAQRRSADQGRRIGVYPETKHPSALEALGLSFDEPLLSLLNQYGFSEASDPAFIQSFESANLKRLRRKTRLRQIYLTDKVTAISMSEIAEFADGIGPYKELLLDEDKNDTGFVRNAHNAGLAVHPWTFRDDDISPDFEEISVEMDAYIEIGIDGYFTDFADTGYRVREIFKRRFLVAE